MKLDVIFVKFEIKDLGSRTSFERIRWIDWMNEQNQRRKEKGE